MHPSRPNSLTMVLCLAAAMLVPSRLDAAQLSLSWSDNSDSESGFKIERSLDGSTFSEIASVAADTESYMDTGLLPTTTYWYRVRAFNAAGNSDYSNPASATTSSNLLDIGNFELFNDGLASGWATQNAGGVGLNVTADTGRTGQAQKISVTTANSWGMFFYHEPVLSLGQTYVWRFWYKTDGSQDLTASLTDGPHSAVVFDLVLPGTGGSWQQVEKVFTYDNAQATMLRVATNAVGSFWIDDMTLEEAEVAASSSARLINLSTRGRVNGGEPMITGLVISGTGTQSFLIRAIGNSLSDFGITDPVAQPRISLVRYSTGETLLETGGGWEEGSDPDRVIAAASQTGAFPLETGRGDAAVVVDLQPGLYTAVVHDGSGVGGTCLVESYALDDSSTSRLVNLSTRGYAATGGHVMIAGLVISGTESKRVLVRGVGPALTGFGVSNALSDPQVAIFRQGVADAIAQNNDWDDNGAASQVATLSADLGAFPLADGSTDAALVIDLTPGIYTVHLSPATGNPGTGLIEVYEAQP